MEGLPLQLEVSAVPSVQELLHMQLPPPPRMSGHSALLCRRRSCKHSETSKRKKFELPPWGQKLQRMEEQLPAATGAMPKWLLMHRPGTGKE